METFSFYLNDPFVFDIIKDFTSIFPEISEDGTDKIFLSIKNAETDTIKRNIKKVFKELLLTIGFIYDKDSGILKVKLKDEDFTEFLSIRTNFFRMMDFFNDIGYVFYHCLLSLIICNFYIIGGGRVFLKAHLKAKKLYSYKDHPSNYDDIYETPFRGLTFNGSNSCYTDSVLMALFTEPNDFIKKRILDAEFIKQTCEDSKSFENDIENRTLIKKELQKIYAFIQNKDHDIEEKKGKEDSDDDDEDDEDDEEDEDSDDDEEDDDDDEEDEDDEDSDDDEEEHLVGDFHKLKSAKYKCTNLRKTFENCKGDQPFHEGETQDAGHFLMYLLRIFELLDVSVQKSYSYGTDSSKNPFVFVSERNEYTSPIVSIVESVFTKLDIDDTHVLTKFMIQSDTAKLSKSNTWKPTTGPQKGKEFKYRKNVIKQIPQVPFIVFYIKRSFIDDRGKEKFYTTKMYPPEKILMRSYQVLHLSAIVIHTGGAHYVAVLKRENLWWYYNDLGTQLYKIGNYNEMLKFNKSKVNPLTHGTLYFYT